MDTRIPLSNHDLFIRICVHTAKELKIPAPNAEAISEIMTGSARRDTMARRALIRRIAGKFGVGSRSIERWRLEGLPQSKHAKAHQILEESST